MKEIYLVTNHALERRTSPAATDHNSANILRINDYSCSLVSAGSIVGRVSQIRSALNMGVNESRDSFISRYMWVSGPSW